MRALNPDIFCTTCKIFISVSAPSKMKSKKGGYEEEENLDELLKTMPGGAGVMIEDLQDRYW